MLKQPYITRIHSTCPWFIYMLLDSTDNILKEYYERNIMNGNLRGCYGLDQEMKGWKKRKEKGDIQRIKMCYIHASAPYDKYNHYVPQTCTNKSKN